MKIISVSIVLLVIFLSSCGTASPGSVPTIPPLSAISATNPPVAAVPISTASPGIEPTASSSPLQVEELQLEQINMIDETSGWGWAVDGAYKSNLLHTSDGGLAWENVLPDKDLFQGYYSSFLLDAQTAWIILADESLARTSDAGQTWKVVHPNLKDVLVQPFRDWYQLRFADPDLGWLVAGYSAAGAHEFFYETQDGGVTWKPMDFITWPEVLSNHQDFKNELAFWSMIDVIYYDPLRFIIAPAEQDGVLKLFLTEDGGASWKTAQLPPSDFPDQSFNPTDRKITKPIFFDPKSGILTVNIWDRKTNTVQIYIYGTTDGGLTWTLTSGPTILEQAGSEILFLSEQDAMYVCGVQFCLTYDGGRTWTRHDFGTDIPMKDDHTFFQLNFVNRLTGWMLIRVSDAQGNWIQTRLFNTTDGGLTWSELSPSINP